MRTYIFPDPQTGHATSDPDSGEVIMCDLCGRWLDDDSVKTHPAAPGEEFCASCFKEQDWSDPV